ncbi:hypothetical protein H5410_039917 [Solanum commersonii]|uniref:Uncharacterized protein n=1 Tax=Solanum commersonii TaxID=4109 RepID=A0A9J5XMC6_SOLCO|nr:hypothetical protein H5410_039917 [Solanum commersonii]
MGKVRIYSTVPDPTCGITLVKSRMPNVSVVRLSRVSHDAVPRGYCKQGVARYRCCSFPSFNAGRFIRT